MLFLNEVLIFSVLILNMKTIYRYGTHKQKLLGVLIFMSANGS